MDIKKILTIGASASMLALVSACSDPEPKNPVVPDNPTQSSGNEVPVAKSSSSRDVLRSSSSLKETDDPQMACSEVMYNYAKGSSLEWVEIYIAGGMDMDNMADFTLHLSGDVDYTFPAESLKKGEYVVVTNNLDEFRAAYPTFNGRLFGPMGGKMVNEGGVVNVKVRGEGDVTCAFSSEPPWPSLADAKGRSLVYTGGIAAQSVSWCASAIDGGNPGVGNDACIDVVNTVRINEVMPNVRGETGYENAWIELYNSGSQPVDVSGWTLDVRLRKETLTIKSGVVPAGGYLVLDGDADFDKKLVINGQQGGEIYLHGALEGQESSIWIPAGSGASGIVDVADGSIAQGPLATATPGAANSPLKLGSIYINEIHYHPVENGDLPFEYMELVNGSDQDIALYSSSVKKGWKVEGINIEFGNVVFPAHSMILLIPETLEDASIAGWGVDFVRASFKIPENVQIITYKGKLSNRGETIAVKEPISSADDENNVTKYYYAWHDATLYSDAWAGLTEADGAGFSLQRVDLTTMGYGPNAWKAAQPTPGK